MGAGAQVRCAVAAVNTKGPSAASDWTDPITVHRTAYATINGFGAAPTADSLTLYRQIQPKGRKWGPIQVVAVIKAPIPTGYDDKDKGGDDW